MDALNIQTQLGSVPKSVYDILLEMPDAWNEAEKFPELLNEAKNWEIRELREA